MPTASQGAGQAGRDGLRVFLNYRRDDASGHAGRLYDALVERFGEDRVFMDVDTIDPGADYADVIDQAVGSCDALLAVIGREWLNAVDAKERRRLDQPDDFVRLEIKAALDRGVRVLPLLVQGAVMPSSEELPEAIAKLAQRNALEISDARWNYDVTRLEAALDRIELQRAGHETAPAESPELVPRGREGDAAVETEIEAEEPEASTGGVASRVVRRLRSRRGAVLASVAAAAAIAVFALVLSNGTKHHGKPKTRGPGTPGAAAETTTKCGRGGLSFCFPLTVNAGIAVPPLLPTPQSERLHTFRLDPDSLKPDRIAQAALGAAAALSGTYSAPSGKVPVTIAAFPSETILQTAFTKFAARAVNDGCRQFDEGTLSHQGRPNGSDVVFDCAKSSSFASGGRAAYFSKNNLIFASFRGQSAPTVDRFLVSFAGAGGRSSP